MSEHIVQLEFGVDLADSGITTGLLTDRINAFIDMLRYDGVKVRYEDLNIEDL